MPYNNSWNNRWSGEDRKYVKIYSFTSKKDIKRALEIIDKGSFRYSFGDGWVACVTVEAVDAKEARRLRKISQGFCGYDWMIDSIRDTLEIKGTKC